MAAVTRWQYKTVTKPIGDSYRAAELLAPLGDRGWELVAVIRHPNNMAYYLKRPSVPRLVIE